ncbi:energy transducer TonB [bacterium]|nr:energy transducer TonB [candidate division CSSED10-310 bacterium]
MNDITMKSSGERNNQYAQSIRKAVLAAILLHIMLFYCITQKNTVLVSAKPVTRESPHFDIHPIVLPPTPKSSPAPQRRHVSRNTHPKRVIRVQAIRPASVAVVPTIGFDPSIEESLNIDLSNWEMPNVEPPDSAPYTLNHPLIVPPRCVIRISPECPPVIRRLGLQGSVTVRVVINRDGVPDTIEIIESFNPVSDQAARDAIVHWRYEPATINDIPVPVEILVTVVFSSRL